MCIYIQNAKRKGEGVGSCHDHWAERRDAPAQGGVQLPQACRFGSLWLVLPASGSTSCTWIQFGVAKCTADEAVQQPVLNEMRAIDAQNKEAAAAAAAQRQLDRKCLRQQMWALPWYLRRSCGVQWSSEQTWLSAPMSWSRGLARHQHEKSSATARSARAVMQRTVAAKRSR